MEKKFEKGKEEEKLEMAKKLKNEGISLDIISKTISLSIDQILHL